MILKLPLNQVSQYLKKGYYMQSRNVANTLINRLLKLVPYQWRSEVELFILTVAIFSPILMIGGLVALLFFGL